MPISWRCMRPASPTPDAMTGYVTRSSLQLQTGALILIASCWLLGACSPAAHEDPEMLTLSGPTMGTRYSIKIVGAKASAAQLSQQVESELARLNDIFSTYTPDSEISALNQKSKAGDYEISAELWRVMKRADEIAEASGGAFDMTISPLVALWGFSTQGRPAFAEIERELAVVKTNVGRDLYTLMVPGVIRKHNPHVTFDLSAIAKGYAVDVLAELLAANGFTDFLVDTLRFFLVKFGLGLFNKSYNVTHTKYPGSHT